MLDRSRQGILGSHVDPAGVDQGDGDALPLGLDVLAIARDAGLEVPRVERPGESERRAEAGDLTAHTLEAARFYRAQLKEAPRAIAYLKDRGLTGAIAARFGIGYAPDAWQPLVAVFDRYDDPALETAGLVIAERSGRERLLWFDPTPIQWIHDRWTTEFSAYWATRLTRLKFSAEGAEVTRLPTARTKGRRHG